MNIVLIVVVVVVVAAAAAAAAVVVVVVDTAQYNCCLPATTDYGHFWLYCLILYA